nr:YodL domain-containing protein [Ruminococcus sp.]
MANSIPVGHYSQLGKQTIKRMANDDVEYMNFLKYFGRVFKHPVSVALEFYVNRPEAQFIASGNQWKRAGYQVNPASIGIQFLDQKGNEVTLYDFEDVIGDYPPKRWTITNKNVDAIRKELGLPKDTPLFSALDESAASAIDDLSLIQDLELTDLSNEDKLKFRNSYHNMIQTMIAGRLEINGARYNVQPDRAALEFCKSDEQMLMLLTSASSSARKALTSVEYAFDTLRTENALRKEEQNNDLRTVESSQRRAENASPRNVLSSDTERAAGERTDRVPSGEEGRTAGLDNNSESRRSGEIILDSGNNNENYNIRGNDDRAAVSSEPVGRTVYPDDTERTVNGERTGGTVWQNVDGEHGEELSIEGRADDVQSQLSDGSSVSGQESSGVLRTAEREVGQGQSSSDNRVRSSTAVVENEEVRNRPLGNDGNSSRSGNDRINEALLNDLISRVSRLTPVINAVINSDKENAVIEIKAQCAKTLTFMTVENLQDFGSFHDALSEKFSSDELFTNELAERIYTDVSDRITPNDRIADKWTNIDVIVTGGDESIDWVYYNPDSTEGGQLVINHISHDQLKDAARFEDPYDYLQSIAKQELIDISAADFADTANYYYDFADNNKALFVCRTGNAKEIEMFINEYTQQLDNLIDNQNYAAYRASLRNTRFTKLNESQTFNYSHSKFVEAPENSIWGEVQSSVNINNGIYEVSTASHGGIMIKSEIARIVLSKEAQAVAQKENGWYYFEEDCDYAVAKRELLDKGLFDNIDLYFSRQYNKKTDEFFSLYSDSLNESIQRWHSKYWDSREVALFNALSPEEQAEEIGQLSFADNVADEADEAETAEIRNHAIETTMDDIRKRIERIEAANGDPNELATQVNMLNFLQTAAKQGVEITSENFKSFVAENGVATNSNTPENYYEIYQLKNGEEFHYHRFTSYEQLTKEGNIVDADNYNLIYTAELTSGTTLEDIYTRFNAEHPEDFKGHSLSVSDVIVVHDNGNVAAYYVDDVGFKRVPEFLKLEHTAVNAATSSNEETAVVTSSNDNEQAIHDGFAAVYGNHNYSDKQKQFLERLENFAVSENVTANIIDTAFEKAAAFHNTYGNREYVSRNIFGRRLGSTERELVAAIQTNIAKTSEKEPVTLDEVIAKFYGSDSSEVKSADGTWSINYTDGNEFAEVYHNGNAACAVLLENDVFSVKPYEELSAVPAMVARAMKAVLPDTEVQLLQFERTFENDFEKAQYLINSFCESEYGSEADFSDMHNIGIAYTTLTDAELPVQVSADLIDHRITYEFDGEIYSTEQYSGIRDMVENGLTGLDFNELVSVPDDVIERHEQSDVPETERYSSIYMTLSRCQQDCNYAINRADKINNLTALNKYMYGGDAASCIRIMREFYDKLPDNEKPEWLSAADIDSYEQQLNDIITQIRAKEAKAEPQALVSAEINGEISYYKLSGVSQEDIMNTAKAEAPLLSYENIGTRISEVEYAEIQQSSVFLISVELNFDEDTVSIYSVNGGQGGIAEGDRTDDNISIENYKLSEYRRQNTGLGAEKITINAEDAISMWENGFTVYYNDEAVPNMNEAPENFDRTETFSDDKIFTAAFGDVKQQNMIDIIADNIHELDAVMDEDRYVDIRGFIETNEDNAFEWNDNLNVYQNVEKALIQHNYSFIDEYLTAVQDTSDSIRADIAHDTLVEYNNYGAPFKKYNTVIDVPEYGISVDLKETDRLYLRDDYSVYEGGIDSNGHERKDNFSSQSTTLTVTLDAYGTANVEEYNSYSDFSPTTNSEFDLSNKDEVHELRDKVAAFIRNSEQLLINTEKYGKIQDISVQEAAVATSSNDIEKLTDEKNAMTLADVEVGDILLTREPETGEAMYFRIDSMNDNFMVSMTRVADAAGNDYNEIGLATKGIINGHWKETLLDENTDFPILRFTKNYQEELKQQQNSVATSSNDETDVVTSSKNIEASIRPIFPRDITHKRASRAEMLYREFIEAFPDIANGSHTHERYGDYDEYGENDAFEPLSVEALGDNTYAFMTWYVQNGDLMRDPDFVFTLDHERKELHVWEYQIDGVPPMGTIYQNVELEDGTADYQLQAALEENFRMNIRNAVAVGRELSAYTDADGEEHELQEWSEHIAEPEQPEIHDDSAYYREVLNEFSEKYGLGELNIRANDNGFVINEKFNDGMSVPIWYITKYNAEKPLTVEEVSAALENFEKTAEKNGYTVPQQINHENLAKNHAGITELPMVQDDLPEIKYADNPYSKVRDNITAIREMRRLEECEEKGDYPYAAGRNSYYSEEACTERLRRYSGWGGVSQVFDERFTAMSNLRKQLREQLSAEEYAAARSSTLNSHYTPQVIIDEMYKTIRNMGLPENSRILEPSCGTGNFITRMPHDMGKGGIVGVELDPITAKIAKHLNVPKHNPYAKKDEAALEDTRDIKILNCGFEKANLENNSFDVVIGNVPFGDYKLNDPDYTNDWLIHDAFFRKALDKVAAGGVVAFITSSGTLDKKNPKVREQLAMRADLIGAVRLPNNAFADADTKVTSDIIFLQKRKTPLNVYDAKPDWCYTAPIEVEMVGKKYEGEKRTAYINSYFAKNPQMVLGTIKQTTHFDMLTCEPNEGRTLQEQLETAFRQLNAKITIENRERSNLEKRGYIEPWGKSFTYQIKDDKVYYNLGNAMEEVEGSDKTIAKLKLLCELRDVTRELLNKQQSYARDEELIPLRNKLNAKYDSFVKDNGELSSKSVKKLFSLDADYPILDALENIDPDTKKITKADIFTRRTVSPVAEITEVASSEEAMQISLDKKGRVDIAYMATLLQNKYENAEITDVMKYISDELLDKGMIFRDPEKIATDKPYAEIVDKSEYLCGNVRRKLVMAETFANQDSSFSKNVEALKEVIPEEIGAAEISADLGCTWIDTSDYEAFMRELSGRTEYDSRNFSIRFSEITGKFSIENSKTKNISTFNPNEISTYGTEDMNMYHILENLLNQKKIQVFDYFPDPNDAKKVKSVLNKNKTQVAQSKAKAIKEKFSEWIFATEQRKEKYVKRYNEKFNNLVGRTYDGSHLTFSGMANDFKLRPHQLNCVARTIYGGNTLAAHCVGAGKSAVIAASVMKKKELGLIRKACVVVPKPLTEQTEREWRTAFPDAKLLVVDNKDLSDEKKRELFTARVATGDYDAIIMSQEQYEKLPMSPQHQLEFLNKQKAELLDQLTQSKRENGRRDPTVKELEAAIKRIEARIDAIANPKSKSRGKDSLLNFESLGFDYLVVDEAHAYKNGFVSTKMGDVSGVNTRESGRAGDMQMKCDYFNSELGNGHILFATGTPVSNSMTELYVMTRYLRPGLLEDCGCARFDDWAATFGMIKTQNKKTATGELKLKTCFAGFKNRPELIKMYKDFADLITIEKIAAPDKDGNAPTIVVPKVKTGKPQIIEVEATPEQREIVKDFARRGRAIQLGNVRPDEDNLLKITGEARLVGLGNRAVLSVYEKNNWEPPIGFVADDKSGKIDKCIENVAEIYKNRYDKNAVQIIFSDIAVNSDDGKFSAYEYIRDELIANGVKEDEIIFAPKSDAKNRAEIFRDINDAKYRIVIASTGTLGTGANIQKNLYALHHLDIPWRPSDFEQREGRIVRQGNLNDEVEIFNYVTKGTLDSYLYQGVTDKARGIAQLWNDTCISRTSEDIDEKVLTFGELEAAAEGNPKLRQFSELKNKIDELQVVRAEYNKETTRVERRIKELPETIDAKKSLITSAKNDLITAKKMQIDGKIEELKLITHDNRTLTERKHINSYLAKQIQLRIEKPYDDIPSFKVGDFKITVAMSSDRANPDFAIKGGRSAAYRIGVGVGENTDNCQRLMNFFDKGIEKIIEIDTQSVEKDETDLAQAIERAATKFPSEEEYQETLKEFEELEIELTTGGYLDNGEEICGAEDYGTCETERLDSNSGYDDDDLIQDEYNSTL